MGHQEDIVKTESKIIVIRDTQVILDRDVAELYGVTTKVVNQAIRNNPDKFPSGYVIELTNSEKEYVVKNFDHLETLKFSHATVKGFTEYNPQNEMLAFCKTKCSIRKTKRIFSIIPS